KAKFSFSKNEFIKQTVLSLKTPLFNITSISEVLLEDIEVIQNNYLSKDIKSILDNAKFLNNILKDLSDYSLLESNSIVLNKQPLDLKTIIDVAIVSVDFSLKTKKITFVNNLKDNLPLIDGDEDRIHQIFYNIFLQIMESSENCTVFIFASIVPGYVKVKIKYAGNVLEIPSTNSSIYLHWTENDRIENFQKFINLVVTSKLVKLHGGKIYSKRDEESSIIIFLPISSNQTRIPAKQIVKKKNWTEYHIYPNSSTNTLQFITEEQERILVIDDEIMNLDTLKSILTAYNYRPILVSSAQEGLEEIHKDKPDLVLVDLFMSGMDGLKFCQLVRELYDKNELPIILITSSSRWEELAELFDLINDTIIKPFTKEKLISRVKASINLARINRAYKRFVPPEFINLLNKKDISELRLGDHVQKRMTILFSDLRNYTKLSESMKPEENFSFLNSYLGRIGPIVRNHHGFIDKYIGDAIMAIFPRNAEDSVKSAIEIQKEIHEFNMERIQKGEIPITAGIGIHTGDVILGTLGEEKRMEGTVISDTVNIASRLENLTKLYQASILITMETFLELDDQELYNFRILDRVKVKGKEQFITVVEIMDGYEEEK
ncbi:MAG: response regulator, partial [Leptospiraceae bacterium]|nr:response regulator [Leptospiraceae bacterium]